MSNKDDIIFTYIHEVKKALILEMDKETALLGLTPLQGRILFKISRLYREGIKTHQSEMMEMLHLSKSTVSGYINRLVSKGFLIRIKEDNKILLVPTENALALEHKFDDSIKKIENRALDGLDNVQKEQLKVTLSKILENLKGGE